MNEEVSSIAEHSTTGSPLIGIDRPTGVGWLDMSASLEMGTGATNYSGKNGSFMQSWISSVRIELDIKGT